MTTLPTMPRPAMRPWTWAVGAVAVACLMTSAGEEGAVADTATLAKAAKRLPIDRDAPAKVATATFAFG